MLMGSSRARPDLVGYLQDFDSVTVSDLRRRRGRKWQQFGDQVLPAWVADMDFRIAAPIRAALQSMIARDDLGYPGLDAQMADVTVERMAERFGWQIDPNDVLVTNNVLQPLTALVTQWSQPGDGVLMSTPIYFPFLMAVNETGRRVVANPLGSPETGSKVDVEHMRRVCDERTRVILVCNPHNPSGRVLTLDELIAIGELAVERDMLIISDEVHADLIYDGNRHVPIASIDPRFAARTVTVTSATKAFNIAGLRLGLAIFGSWQIRERWQASMHPFVLGMSNTAGLVATIAAWTECDDWLEALIRYLDANRRYVAERIAAIDGASLAMPEATFLAWLDLRGACERKSLESPAEYLARAGVVLSPGDKFGPEGQGFARLNFATSRPVLKQVLDSVEKALN